MITPAPVLTIASARAYTGMVLRATAEQVSARSWRINTCRRSRTAASCGFAMDMNGTVTCSGRVRFSVARGGLEYQYVRVVCK